MPFFKAIFVIVFCSLSLVLVQGQNGKQSLENERQSLIQEIERTSELLKLNSSKKVRLETQYKLLSNRLEKRRSLVQLLRQEQADQESEIAHINDTIEILTKNKEAELAAYKKLLNQNYINNKTRHPFYFLFDDFIVFRDFKKWIYFNQLDAHIQRRLRSYQKHSDLLLLEKNKLEEMTKQRQVIIEQNISEQRELEKDTKKQKSLVGNIKKDLNGLKSRLKEQKKKRVELNNRIESLILKELSKQKKKDFSLLPEAEIKRLSGDFGKNKGKMPWPVEKGVVMSKFGRQAHPHLKGVYIDNAGIDIQSTPLSPVKCIFNGVVVGTSHIAGFQNMVVISHGHYYSVYSKLQRVDVNEGQKVVIGQVIGTTSSLLDDGGNFHFEIWENKKKIDPQKWLKK